MTWAASITKGIFATYVMQLVERCELDLDIPIDRQLARPINQYDVYRETASALAGDPQWQSVTPRHLLSHTAGFLNFAFLEPDKKLRIHSRRDRPSDSVRLEYDPSQPEKLRWRGGRGKPRTNFSTLSLDRVRGIGVVTRRAAVC